MREGAGGRAALARYADARVLVVDDNATNVLVLERVLRAAGLADVHAVTDPREAVERCLAVDADLVLLDLHMPHLDGHEVLRALRAALPEDSFLPVVVLTGDVTTETRDRALAAGATDFLTKPLDHTEVVLRVGNLLATRTLHLGVQRHVQVLEAELEAREEEARRRTLEMQAVRGRIDAILRGAPIEMAFQPIVHLGTGAVRGVEALARFRQEPYRPPNEWFDEAATAGRGNELELAAAGAAMAHLEQLPKENFLAINLSPDAALDPTLTRVLDGRATDRVVLELTEHAQVEDYPRLLDQLEVLRTRGVRIAVDDAGAGFSGLRHILQLRPEILKLDLTLTAGIDLDPARRALATALVTFADEIGATIVAEGIETQGELDTLRALGVPWGQGYHLARPGPDPRIVQVPSVPPVRSR